MSAETTCPKCGESMTPGCWPFCDDGTGKNGHAPSRGELYSRGILDEPTIVWEHPIHGVRYPGRNDRPMPQKYAEMGFKAVNVAAGGLRQLDRWCAAHNKVHEKSHYNSNGRGFDED